MVLDITSTPISCHNTSCRRPAVEPRERRDQLKNPLWIEDKALRKGKVEFLPANEIQFWKDLIAQYLWPLDENKEEKVSRIECRVGPLVAEIDLTEG